MQDIRKDTAPNAFFNTVLNIAALLIVFYSVGIDIIFRRSSLSLLNFRSVKGAADFNKCSNFISLLWDIRLHLLQSQSTRAVCLSAAKSFYDSLSPIEQHSVSSPSDNDFCHYVTNNWPTFCSFTSETPNRVRLGYVTSTSDCTNEVNLLSDIVVAAELADMQAPYSLTLEQYNLIITIVVLHELRDAFTKFWFHGAVTAARLGSPDIYDIESRENSQLLLEWDALADFGNMEAINRVVLLDGSNSWEIDADTAKAVVSSLRGTTLYSPDKAGLKHSPRLASSVRAQLTGGSTLDRKAASVSLGGPVRSMAGNEKWNSYPVYE